MSRLYDAVEPSIINEAMLFEAIDEQGPVGLLKKLKNQEETEFKEITSIRLEFKNILKIDNLIYFTSLTFLQMDNNVIEKIEGLDALVNLKNLDLSFNNIEVIEGLDNLRKLEILNLFSNRISEIKNMDNLLQLTILSLGNNSIQDINQLIYLRRHEKLKTLVLYNNPLALKEEYKLAVSAIIPNIRYLDYLLVPEKIRTDGREKYSILVDEVEADELVKRQKIESEEQQRQEENINKEAFISSIINGKLLNDMFAEDAEGNIFRNISFLEDTYNNFASNFNKFVDEICEYSLSERINRDNDVQFFRKCLDEVKTQNRNEALEIIILFEETKNQLIATFEESMDIPKRNSLFEKYSDFVDDFQDQLFFIEVRLTEQIEDVTREFELNVQENINAFFEKNRGLLRLLREVQGTYNENVIETGLLVLEKYLKNELAEDVAESIKTVFIDKDTMTSSAMTSHDLHLLKIDTFEDYIMKNLNLWFEELMKELNQEEIERNRERIKEIYNYLEYCKEEFEDMIEMPE